MARAGAIVNVTNITVLNNPSSFIDPFQFEITFECLQPLAEDLEWKIVYVGSAESDQHDQELESVLVGPVPVGVNKFVFQADAPDISLIPQGDILGVTVVLVTCSYKEEEFIRVGYYVNNAFVDPQMEENPPPQITGDMLNREILAQKPRVTRFPIKWDSAAQNELPDATAGGSMETDENMPQQQTDQGYGAKQFDVQGQAHVQGQEQHDAMMGQAF